MTTCRVDTSRRLRLRFRRRRLVGWWLMVHRRLELGQELFHLRAQVPRLAHVRGVQARVRPVSLFLLDAGVVCLEVPVVEYHDVEQVRGVLELQTRFQSGHALAARFAVVAHHHVHRGPVLLWKVWLKLVELSGAAANLTPAHEPGEEVGSGGDDLHQDKDPEQSQVHRRWYFEAGRFAPVEVHTRVKQASLQPAHPRPPRTEIIRLHRPRHTVSVPVKVSVGELAEALIVDKHLLRARLEVRVEQPDKREQVAHAEELRDHEHGVVQRERHFLLPLVRERLHLPLNRRPSHLAALKR
mmetsp:Transcript_45513/g.84568  ORF Transcript_45513/g.84568 Transcript_45513/m.84568 type:complete len:298 (+) Transcript_45513:2052-2945(+)